MLTWNTTRQQTVFSAFVGTTSESISNPNSVLATTAVVSSATTYQESNGQTFLTRHATTSFIDSAGISETTQNESFATYTSNDSLCTSHSYSSGFGTFVDAGDNSGIIPNYTIGYNTTTLVISNTTSISVTANINTTVNIYSISNSSTTLVSVNTTLKSSTTSEVNYSTVSLFATEVESNMPVELGTIVSNQGWEWLWSFTFLPSSQIPLTVSNHSWITEIATSFSRQTFWPNRISSSVSLVGYSGNSTSSWDFPANSSTFLVEGLSFYNIPTTITTGSFLSRNTITTEGQSFSTTSSVATIGNNSYSVNYLQTRSVLAFLDFFASQITSRTLVLVGFNNQTTTTLRGYNLYVKSLSTAQSVDIYLATESSTNSTYTSSRNVTNNRTDTTYLNLNTVNNFGAANTLFSPVAPVGAFASPTDLLTNNLSAFGANLNFQNGQILEPGMSSILKNLISPVIYSSTTSETNSVSWTFSWSSNTLYYTRSSGTILTSSNGTLAVLSSQNTFYSDGGSVFGGYADIINAFESRYSPPRAVFGISIDTNGNSTSYRSIYNSSTFSSLKETMIAESSLPAYLTYATYTDNAGLPVISFANSIFPVPGS